MPPPPVEVEDLVYAYRRGAPPAVDHLSFSVRRGEILGLLGPNGAGKTTTLQAILGLVEPSAGSVRVFGFAPLRHRVEALRRLNFASADVDLPSNLTVRECLSVFAGLYDVPEPGGRIGELLERFELEGFERHLVGSLSSGEQMRLKLAKALLNRPELLVLDEPTRSLDPYMAQKVRDLLRTIQKQESLSVLHTSHNMHEVETFCDRILFLHRGKTLAEGPPEEVLARFRSTSLVDLFLKVAASGELVPIE